MIKKIYVLALMLSVVTNVYASSFDSNKSSQKMLYDLQINICNSQLTAQKRLNCLTNYNNSIINAQKAEQEEFRRQSREWAKVVMWDVIIIVGLSLAVILMLAIWDAWKKHRREKSI